jgi:hypothetical protein
MSRICVSIHCIIEKAENKRTVSCFCVVERLYVTKDITVALSLTLQECLRTRNSEKYFDLRQRQQQENGYRTRINQLHNLHSS